MFLVYLVKQANDSIYLPRVSCSLVRTYDASVQCYEIYFMCLTAILTHTMSKYINN